MDCLYIPGQNLILEDKALWNYWTFRANQLLARVGKLYTLSTAHGIL